MGSTDVQTTSLRAAEESLSSQTEREGWEQVERRESQRRRFGWKPSGGRVGWAA